MSTNYFGDFIIQHQHINTAAGPLLEPHLQNQRPFNRPVLAPVPEPNLPLRARQGLHCDDLPPIHENQALWKKVSTVPTHLMYILLPKCNLWAYHVSRDLLWQVMQHFLPDFFIAQRTTKPKFIRLFYEHVIANYGKFYGFWLASFAILTFDVNISWLQVEFQELWLESGEWVGPDKLGFQIFTDLSNQCPTAFRLPQSVTTGRMITSHAHIHIMSRWIWRYILL